MHPALLTSYATMLPRLQAEEDLRLVASTMAGTLTMKSEARREFVRDLSRTANAGRPVEPVTKGSLASMGIRVKEVPRVG